MTTVLERLELLIDSKLNSQGIDAAKKGVGDLSSAVGPADQLINKLGLTGKVTGEQLATLGAGAAAAGIAGLAAIAVDGVNKFQTLAGEVLHFQQVSGTSADTASRFVAVMDDYKVSADQGAIAIGRLGKNVATTPESLEKLGVVIAKTSAGTVDMTQTFFNVVDAFNATTDASKQAELGTAAFGRGWQNLSNLLSQGSNQLRASFDSVSKGQLLSDSDLRKAEQYRLAMDELSDATRDLEMELGKALIPALTVIARDIAWVAAKADELGSKLSVLKTPIRVLAAAVSGGTSELLLAGNTAVDTGFKFESLGATAAAVANNTIDLRNAMEAVLNTASQSEAAQSRLEHAQIKLGEAQERVANGGKTNAEMLQEQATSTGRATDKTKQLENALRGVENAERRVGDAQQSLTDAQDAYAESQKRLTQATKDLEDAQLSLLVAHNSQPREASAAADATAEAKRRQANAELDLADAQDKLAQSQQAATDATEAYGAGSPQALKAQRDLRRAELDLEQSKQDLKDAQKDVNEATRDQIAVDVDLKSVSGNLEDAQKAVEDATKGVEDAQKSNQQSARTLEQRNRDLEDAVRAVADANQNVIDVQNQRDAGAPAHNAVTKTTKELELDLRDAEREVRDASKEVADKAGDQEAALGTLKDLMNNESTPAAQAAKEKTDAIRGAIEELTKTLDPNSDAYKFLQGYAQLLGTVNSLAGGSSGSYTASGSSSANAAERGLATEVVPIKINLDGQAIANVIAPLIRSQARSNG